MSGRRLLGTQPRQAEAHARAILRTAPERFDARLLLGAALRRSGEAREALDVLNPLADAQPRAWGVHLEIGAAFAMLGDTQRAISALTRASELNPTSGAARHALGDQLSIQGQDGPAAQAQGQSPPGFVHDPAVVEAAVALLQGGGDDARSRLQDRFNLHPSDPLSVRLIADVGLRRGLYAQVEALVSPMLDRAPHFTPLRHSLALALHGQTRFLESAAEVERLLAQHANALPYRLLQAALLVEIADYDQACRAYEAILATHPSEARIWLSYGHVLKILGSREKCVAAYRRALTLAPSSGDAYWSLANLKLTPFDSTDRAAMAALLADERQAPESRAPLHYAYAKALEDHGRYEEAFTHYSCGATLKRAQSPWNAEANGGYVRAVAASFTTQFFAEREGLGCEALDPIFIVGLPRSGSTLVEQILSSHTQVEGLSERPQIMAMARGLAAGSSADRSPYPASLSHLDRAAFRRLGEAYLAGVAPNRRQGRPFFVDKFPTNFMHIGLIHLILPNARIIDVRRHAMACCTSLFRQYFADGQAYSYDLSDLGHYYREYINLMDHFDRILPGRVLHVSYEDLVLQPESQIRRLLDHCRLPFERQCLRPHETKRAVRTASSQQVRQPISADGLDQWRNFAPWLGPLEHALNPDRAPKD